MEITDFYQLLNIPRKASPDEIEKAFYALSEKYTSKSFAIKEDRDMYTKLFTAYYILYQEEPRIVYEECSDKLSGKAKASFSVNELHLYARYAVFLADAKNKSFRSLKKKRNLIS
jgi:DnaJ-class molecular chaperone